MQQSKLNNHHTTHSNSHLTNPFINPLNLTTPLHQRLNEPKHHFKTDPTLQPLNENNAEIIRGFNDHINIRIGGDGNMMERIKESGLGEKVEDKQVDDRKEESICELRMKARRCSDISPA